jgi:hypothetical protein
MEAMDKKAFRIRFEETSVADAGIMAADMRQKILDSSEEVQVEIERQDESFQEFGATMILILGSPAIIAVAKGIANYLNRQRGKITIEADGRVIAEGISGADASRIAEAMAQTIASRR